MLRTNNLKELKEIWLRPESPEYSESIGRELDKVFSLIPEKVTSIVFICSEGSEEGEYEIDSIVDIFLAEGRKPIYKNENIPNVEDIFFLYKVSSPYGKVYILDIPISGMGTKLIISVQ